MHPERVIGILNGSRDTVMMGVRRVGILCTTCAGPRTGREEDYRNRIEVQEQDLNLPDPDHLGNQEVKYFRCRGCGAIFDPLSREWVHVSGDPADENKYRISKAARAVEAELRRKFLG
jgi:hypothetical protein